MQVSPTTFLSFFLYLGPICHGRVDARCAFILSLFLNVGHRTFGPLRPLSVSGGDEPPLFFAARVRGSCDVICIKADMGLGPNGPKVFNPFAWKLRIDRDCVWAQTIITDIETRSINSCPFAASLCHLFAFLTDQPTDRRVWETSQDSDWEMETALERGKLSNS